MREELFNACHAGNSDSIHRMARETMGAIFNRKKKK